MKKSFLKSLTILLVLSMAMTILVLRQNVLARKKRGAKVVKKLQVCKFLRTFAAKIAKGHERNTRFFDRIVIQQ